MPLLYPTSIAKISVNINNSIKALGTNRFKGNDAHRKNGGKKTRGFGKTIDCDDLCH